MSGDDPRPLQIAVVGGGLSGLAAAHRLTELSGAADSDAPCCEVTLFEAGDALGGLIETRRLDGYLVEAGADSFITNKPAAVELCRRLGLEDRLIPTDARYRGALVLRRGRPVRVPEGYALLSPSALWPVLRSPIFSLRGKLRLACEYFVPRRMQAGDESLASFVRRRFGREALERLVQPLVGGIYTSDPEKLSLQATLPRFLEQERRYRSLIRAARRQPSEDRAATGARYGLFAAPQEGMSELLMALTERVQATAEVRLRRAATAVHPASTDENGQSPSRPTIAVESAAGSRRFDGVIVGTSAYRAADLLDGLDADLSAALRRIEYASSAIVLSGHKLEDVAHPLDAFGLVVPAIERRKIIAVSFASRKFPGRAPQGRILLRTFIGGAMQPELFDQTDEQMRATVAEELRAMLGVSGKPDIVQIARYPRAMPQYHVGHVQRVDEIERRIAAHAGLELAGNAYRGVGVPDAIASGERAAERLLKDLQAPPPSGEVAGIEPRRTRRE